MAEMVGSIVVGEVVNRTSSFLIGKHRDRLSTQEAIERLEMAHIKMEAALELSSRWLQQGHATNGGDASLLRWRRKLRRAADECDAALHRWKMRELQEEDALERLARAPLPRRVAHAVLRFVSRLLDLARGGGGDDEWSRASAAVQRFERLASGAAEFLRCVELGRAPRRWCGGGAAAAAACSVSAPALGGSVSTRATATRGCREELLSSTASWTLGTQVRRRFGWTTSPAVLTPSVGRRRPGRSCCWYESWRRQTGYIARSAPVPVKSAE